MSVPLYGQYQAKQHLTTLFIIGMNHMIGVKSRFA